jgi:hypothetical protein
MPLARRGALPGPVSTPPPSETPVQVEAPFVFRATQPKPVDVIQVAQLHLSNGPMPELLALNVDGRARVTYYKLDRGKVSAANNKPRGFFSRLRGFFGSMFR